MATLYDLIRSHSVDPSAATRPCLLAPGRSALSYAELSELCKDVARCLAGVGVARGERVIVVLPNGPEMAACFLSVASVATCAPLNPGYTESELNFYFDDLAPKALIVDPELPSRAAAIARARGIPVLALEKDLKAPAGRFTLTPSAPRVEPLPWAETSEIGLVLHTSGTTSRPKMVPLSQANLFASACNIAKALALTPEDRCLNIMPLFHIHGLIGVLLSSLRAGASVVCSPGFQAGKFFDWLADERPTWISAVPTMYEAIASGAGAHRGQIESAPLRLLRSSSASLPPTLMAALEDAFGVPVIEAYGMTEATHQMASNPLPPGARKKGSVGRAAGPEVAIMHPEHCALLPALERGEIAIRGANVTSGYVANPSANATAFSESWFRTGDQGYFDEDGYLFITGRLKEQINRGGEKISPREIDEAILAMPEVRQAVAFAVPHKTLGEEVAAAVVLRPGAELDADTLRARLTVQLAAFKVPARILFVDEIPKGPTGKLQRIGLADQLASLLREDYVAPRTDLERTLAQIWAEVLNLEQVGIRNNFFTLGGDSLRALTVSARAAERGLLVPVDVLFREPTIVRLASHVKEVEDFSDVHDSDAGPLRLYGFQRVVLFPGVATPESFSSPSEVVFALEAAVDRAAFVRAVHALSRQHDAFRMRFFPGDPDWSEELIAPDALSPAQVEATIVACAGDDFVSQVAALHRRFDLSTPPLFRFAFTRGAPSRIAIVAHHLVADAMSMRIIAEDFATAYGAALLNQEPRLAAVPTPAAVFMRRYERAARAGRFEADQDLWTAVVGDEDDDAPVPDWTQSATIASMRHVPLELGPISAHILAYATRHNIPPRDVLLAASVEATAHALALSELRVLLMNSGREQPLFGDLSRTVGCLVNVLPLKLRPPRGSFEEARKWMTDAIRKLPSGGFSIPAVYMSEPSDVWLRVAMQLVASHLFVNYKGVLGPRSALGPSLNGLSAQPCTYDTVRMMTHLQHDDDPVPHTFALQLHFEQVGDALFGDLYCATDIHDIRTAHVLAERLRARLAQIADDEIR